MAELREVTTVNGGQKSVINVVLLSELLSSACLKRVHFFLSTVASPLPLLMAL